MNSDNLLPIFLILGLLVVAGLVIWYSSRKRRSDELRNKFGPEYDYMVEKEGDSHKAELDLTQRERRVSELNIHPLKDEVRERYNGEWLEIQANFVDDPKGAVDQANRLITEVMVARGFPVADFDQRAADLSVLYPQFVPNYRNAYQIAMKNQNDGTSTEELRQAMVYYHSLFAELLVTEREKQTETMR